ncbi:hypothetical protein BV394_14620 [Brevirhabdus pacifica]|uniref:histidine kinase n=2 Tax=Brevirhabdus pacifica TaxID=1267768 RepID=A0A1U7DLM6_9RHOB|nr:ATP-binding protein [Brevirhabdus pacifica]APX90793.1 hypothetical protein BV394_14620 [Brevirhabdus pacifica]PJJ87324.1 PAS/PAC sensor hybrid histidine kinase [Brevirhabdus pacifica]
MTLMRLAIGSVILIGVIITFYLSATLTDRFDKLREAPHDNSQWNLTQLEVDFLKLMNAEQQARQAVEVAQSRPPATAGADSEAAPVEPGVGPGAMPGVVPDPATALDDLRKAFDIFYSRVYVLEDSKDAEIFFRDQELRDHQDAIKMFLHEMAPAMDGDDAMLIATLPRLDRRLAEISALPREIALKSVPIKARISDNQRLEITNLLKAIAFVALIVMIALMLAFAILLLQKSELNRKTRIIARGNERLASTLKASLDAIIVIDEQGLIMDFNGSAEKVFGHARADVLGRSLADVIIPERFREAHTSGMARFLDTRSSQIVDAGRLNLVALHADGHEFQTETSITAVPGEKGINFISYIRDITDEVANRAELHEARDSALAAYREKSKFFAVMSHEMRTPLNGIISSLDLLADTPLNDGQRHFLQIANASSEILLGHINDVLDIERIDANQQGDRMEPVDLADMLEALCQNLRALADRQNTRIGWNISGLEDPSINCDARGLRQILLNLMSNAIKFTTSGRVEVDVQAAPTDNPDTCQLSFAVSDTGIGISEEDQKRIFDDFVTVDSAYERTSTGTGLGLGIARRLVASMGGRLSVESAPKRGSTFTFTVEVPKTVGGQAEAPLAEAEAERPIVPRRVLVVEDNEVNRELLHVMLSGDGHHVDLAEDGFEGVHKASRNHYDLILMDISMPNLDGVKATQMIQDSRGLSAATPIYAVTAHAMPEERAKFLAAGMAGCLIKPLRRADIRTLMAEVPGPQETDGPETARPEDETDQMPDTDAPKPHANGIDPAKMIDLEQFRDIASLLGQEKLSLQLERFEAEGDELIAAMRSDAEQGRLSQVQAAAHRMAGSCGTFGAREMHQHLKSLETACKSEDAAGAVRIAGDLDRVWAETRAGIAAAS